VTIEVRLQSVACIEQYGKQPGTDNAQGEAGTEPQDLAAVEPGSSAGISRLPTTEEDQVRRGIEILARRKANMWNIGTVASVPRPCIYNQGSSNVAVAEERKHYCISLIDIVGTISHFIGSNHGQLLGLESTPSHGPEISLMFVSARGQRRVP